MDKRIGLMALEYFRDLGITVVYATVIGLLIATVVASDKAHVSLFEGLVYVGILPAVVVVLIGLDVLLRLRERRRLAEGSSSSARETDPFTAGRLCHFSANRRRR